jgi:hypothetical protein
MICELLTWLYSSVCYAMCRGQRHSAFISAPHHQWPSPRTQTPTGLEAQTRIAQCQATVSSLVSPSSHGPANASLRYPGSASRPNITLSPMRPPSVPGYASYWANSTAASTRHQWRSAIMSLRSTCPTTPSIIVGRSTSKLTSTSSVNASPS